MQRRALCRSRRELSNAYLLAKFGFDTAENEPSKVCRIPRVDRRVTREGGRARALDRVGAGGHEGGAQAFAHTRPAALWPGSSRKHVSTSVGSVRSSKRLFLVVRRSERNSAFFSRTDCSSEVLQLPENTVIEYKDHDQSLQDNSGYANTTATPTAK